MEEKSNNLRFENKDEKQLFGHLYSQNELKNMLKSILSSDIALEGQIELILAICQPTMVQIPVENYPPKITLSKETT